MLSLLDSYDTVDINNIPITLFLANVCDIDHNSSEIWREVISRRNEDQKTSRFTSLRDNWWKTKKIFPRKKIKWALAIYMNETRVLVCKWAFINWADRLKDKQGCLLLWKIILNIQIWNYTYSKYSKLFETVQFDPSFVNLVNFSKAVLRISFTLTKKVMFLRILSTTLILKWPD